MEIIKFVPKKDTMARNVFSKDNQPEGRGRKPKQEEDKKVMMTTCVSKDCKEWYSKRRGLAPSVLENYYKDKIK